MWAEGYFNFSSSSSSSNLFFLYSVYAYFIYFILLEYNLATPDTAYADIFQTYKTTVKISKTNSLNEKTNSVSITQSLYNRTESLHFTTNTTNKSLSFTQTSSSHNSSTKRNDSFITTPVSLISFTTSYKKDLITRSSSSFSLLLSSTVSPCHSNRNKCANNATCVENTKLSEGFECICFPGFGGAYCQNDENPCQPIRNRCKNNSTCNQFGFRYNCSCPSGFDGFHCETYRKK